MWSSAGIEGQACSHEWWECRVVRWLRIVFVADCLCFDLKLEGISIAKIAEVNAENAHLLSPYACSHAQSLSVTTLGSSKILAVVTSHLLGAESRYEAPTLTALWSSSVSTTEEK